MDLESGLFRMVDEALAAYLGLAAGPGLAQARLADQVEVRVAAIADAVCIAPAPVPVEPPGRRSQEEGRRSHDELPPALAAMIEDRQADERDAAEAARLESIVVLPPSTWREIQARARLDRAVDGASCLGRRVASSCCSTRGRRDPTGVSRAPRGQGLVEYGLILALTTILTVLILVVFGGTLADVLVAIGGAIDAATGGTDGARTSSGSSASPSTISPVSRRRIRFL